MVLSPLQVGSLTLATPLLLAPIAGYTDASFRRIARRFGGLGLACTELLCPEAILRDTPRTAELSVPCAEDSPLCLQLFGCDASRLSEAARWAEDHGAAAVDINMGCPADNITSQNGGASLLRYPDTAVRIVEEVRKVLRRIPLTVKMRLGWDAGHIIAPQLAPLFEAAGAQLITIHGRTAAQGYAGTACLEGIAAVVASVREIPVVGNGDVRSPKEAQDMFLRTGCRGVMIGRMALSMPWVFRDTWSFLTTGTIPPPPSLQEKCELVRTHFRDLVSHRGERKAVLEFRRRGPWYCKQMHPCRELRCALPRIKSAADFDRAMDEFLAWRTQRDQSE